MLDSLWKSKFFTKCKSCLKLTKTRLDAIRRKKNAVIKYLKNDIADLLKNGLDYNAYGRAEGLLVERNILECYNLVDEFCGTISNQLSVLNKQRECPEDCKEAVASLIYAAARFADLPELRDLRNLFTERYGSSIEAFTNKELLEKSRAVPITKEMKLQLIQEIAEESSIEWNSKALEQQLYTPQYESKIRPASKQDADRNVAKTDNNKVASVPAYARKTNSHRRKESTSNDSIFDSSSDDNTTETSTKDSATDRDVRIYEDEADKPFYLKFIPPPYLKPKPDKKEAILEEPPEVKAHIDNKEISEHHHKSVSDEKPKPRSVRRRNLRPPLGRENTDDNVGNSMNDGVEKYKRDDEEKMLDGMLMHYSNKKSAYESNRANGNNLKYSRNQEKDDAEPQGRKASIAEDFAFPARAVSLPADSTSSNESLKMHARANSMQPDMAGHVHPKLPDYEQLAARFAALRGK